MVASSRIIRVVGARRSMAVTALVGLCLSGCGGSDDQSVDQSADETTFTASATRPDSPAVTLTDATGETTITVTTDRVFAADELAAVQLLALGVTPIATTTWLGDLGAQAVADHAGVELLDTAGDAPPIETLAADDVQLVIGTGHPFNLAAADQFRGVADTVITDFTSSWEDQLRVVAQAVGRQDRAEAVIAAVNARITSTAHDVETAGLTGETVSVIGFRPGFGPLAVAQNSLAGTILTTIGFERPAAQQVDGEPPFPIVTFSEEVLTDHDADVIVEFVGEAFGDQRLTESPLLASSFARTVYVAGQPWATSSPLAAITILADIERAIIDGGEPTDADDAVGLFRELLTEST
jgi:iron complex transport system substrate-binding protein